MKNLTRYCFLLSLLLGSSCSQKKEGVIDTANNEPVLVLPFHSISLADLTAFNEVPPNWKVAASVYVDRSKEKAVSLSEGSGILVNNPKNEKSGNLITTFEHGDIEFECDVMMPVNSNSGIYFQSRYEIQLFDSWGVSEPKHGDMGGIYQRWDKTKEEGEEGFEGFPPKINASKSPGLWQRLKIVFHAPKFNESGVKVKNALFEEVRLNGVIIQTNIELSGPTRGGIETKEVSKAPLLFQGDHGPVAFRNIRYKFFEDKKVQAIDLTMKEYEYALPLFPDLDSLVPIREIQTDSISATMATGERPQKLLSYVGKLKIPESGDYIFDFKLNRAGGALLIANDTIISMNGNYNLDSLRISKVTLEKGEVPFQLIYNKHVPWQMGFGLYVEGPGIQKHPLHVSSSLNLPSEEVNSNFMIATEDEPITQRGFWMHEGKKRTHCIAVGNPEGIHYTYDLELGTLLQVWEGSFMDATKMWQGRGEKQLGVPAGFAVSLHGDPETIILKNENDTWPNGVTNFDYKQLGYEFDDARQPVFNYQINGSSVSNKFIPIPTSRGLKREIATSGSNDIWLKVADGSAIEKLPDGTFMVNDESYFIDFGGSSFEPKIRKSDGLDELILKIPSGEQHLEYSIIW